MEYFDGLQSACAIVWSTLTGDRMLTAIGWSTLTADTMFATIFLSIFDVGATDSEGGWQGLSPFGGRDAISITIFLEKVC